MSVEAKKIVDSFLLEIVCLHTWSTRNRSHEVCAFVVSPFASLHLCCLVNSCQTWTYYILLRCKVGSAAGAPFKGEVLAPEACRLEPQAPMVINSSAAVVIVSQSFCSFFVAPADVSITTRSTCASRYKIEHVPLHITHRT